MNEIRSYASLSGNLLARKGGAKPAMRPRPLSAPQMLDDLGWDDMGDPVENSSEHVPSSIAALTPAPRAPVATREEPAPVHVQQQALAERYSPAEPSEPAPLPQAVVAALRAPAPAPTPAPSAPAPAPAPAAAHAPAPKRGTKPRESSDGGKKAAFTLRLDADRHLRLRLASAVTGRSSQQLVTAALDSFLETLPELGAMAQHAPTRAGSAS